jgi:hypothetical protein
MKSANITGLFSLIAFLMAFSAHGQNLDNIKQQFDDYNQTVLQEKIYAHTDKDFYLTGEIMWFKLYNVDAGTNKPLKVSKVAYVEVLDDANNSVLQGKIALYNGLGNGSFYIPVTLKNGNYRVRAYTSWMKNFSADLFFEKQVKIVNPLFEPGTIAKAPEGKYEIKFFPEGGNLVNGLTSTVGFKITGADGKGAALNGVIINQRNDTVARYKVLKFGMGSFEFTPHAGDTYKAVMRIGRDNALIGDFPAAYDKGYVIHLVNSGGKPQLKVSTNMGSQPVYVFVHNGHHVLTAETVTPDAGGNATVAINNAAMAQGINHITLFNNSKQPVCERLYFNRPKLMNLQAGALAQYKPRKEVSLNINANNAAGRPTNANLSVSVYKLDSLNTAADAADITSYMWLSAELKGNIESPAYYFNLVTDETDRALDNLLITQGWSRFNWDDVLKGSRQYVYLPEYDGHLVNALLTDASGKPAKDIMGYLSVISKREQFYGSHADSTGHLLFNTKDFYGPNEIVLQTNNQSDSSYRISVLTPFLDKFSSKVLSPFSLDPSEQRALENGSISMQVLTTYNADKLKNYYNPVLDSTAFFGHIYKSYPLEDYVRFKTMEEDLREYVAEMTITVSQKRVHFHIISPEGILRDGEPLVLLDGVPIFNIDKVFDIDPLKVKELKMVNQDFYWGPVAAPGILSLNSYKGDMGGFEIDPKAVVLDYEGMQLQREFYSPTYITPEQQKSRIPDFRNVLYWSPDVNTRADGKAMVSFYTSDKTGRYIAVIQGINADGETGSYALRFDVQK